jgi:hypothetical protein
MVPLEDNSGLAGRGGFLAGSMGRSLRHRWYPEARARALGTDKQDASPEV